MTLATATIERINLISAVRTMTETPVETVPDGTESVFDFNTALYVTRTLLESRDSLIGTVVQARRHAAGEDMWWCWDEATAINVGVFGSKVNPPMEDGKYYRSLDGHGMLVRYNDDEHAGDRHLEGCSLSILASNGSPWIIPGDGTNWTENVGYIEVEAPASEALSPDTTEPVAEPVDAHQFLTGSHPDGATRGFAKTDEQGRVPLKPATVPGGLYLVWADRGEVWNDTRMTYLATVTQPAEAGVQPDFTVLGYWMRNTAGGTPYHADYYTTLHSNDVDQKLLVWAELKPVALDLDLEATTGPVWNKKSEELQAFEELNEALNELADDNDWCSDYESIIEPLGMTGRNKDKNYTVDVDVDFTFTDEDPSSEFDEEAARRHGIDGLVIKMAEYTASVRVSIYTGEVSGGDAARDYVDSQVLEEHLRSEMNYARHISVDDYTIVDVEESD